MKQSVKRDLAALAKMTVGELRQRHVELFGEQTRSGNRQWLYRRLAWRVQALAEGGLSERAQQRARELTREADIRLRPPTAPEHNGPVADEPRATASMRIPQDARLPAPGTVLTRAYKGHEYRVTVLSRGFEHDGQVYRSLTAVAYAITGSHWNGYHFFAIGKHQRK